jgi:hypothetical protein
MGENMSTEFICGIDPGKTGGWAIIEVGKMRLVDGAPLDFENCDRKLYDALKAWGSPETLLERAQGAEGNAGVFEYGRSFGRTEAAVELAGCRRLYVAPSWWKGKLGCPVDKKRAYALCRRLMPEIDFFAHNGPRGGLDTGTAEAALIAYTLARPDLRSQVEKNNAARVRPKRRSVRFEL